MRRPTRLFLAVAILVLAVVGGYTVYWFVAAGRLDRGLQEWAGSLPAQNLDLSWQAVDVGGFPFGWRAELSGVRLRDRGRTGGEVTVPLLVGNARPWDPSVWRLTAPNGLSATLGSAQDGAARISARDAAGVLIAAGEGGARLWLRLGDPAAEVGVRLAAKNLDLWLDLPAHPPRTHSERAFGLAFDLQGLLVPIVPAPLQNPVDEIALGAALMGRVPTGAPRQAAAAWRDAGGSVELEHFALRWGSIATTLSGTLALDAELQPVAAFSGAISGFDELMSALVGAGRLRPGDARLARLALAMLARPGPDGRPQIATSLTIQNGELYLGPARLGPAPRIFWE